MHGRSRVSARRAASSSRRAAVQGRGRGRGRGRTQRRRLRRGRGRGLGASHHVAMRSRERLRHCQLEQRYWRCKMCVRARLDGLDVCAGAS